jgi:uncharacterized protein YegP (UPF0339 family)
MKTIEIFITAGQYYRWRLLDRNRQILAYSGPGYLTSQEARSSISASYKILKTVDKDSSCLVVEDCLDNTYLWRLLDNTGATVMTSSFGYKTEKETRKSVKKILQAFQMLEIDSHIYY